MKTILSVVTLMLCFISAGFAAGVPDEGTIWVKEAVDARGQSFKQTLMIRHGHLIIILRRGTQLDLGNVQINQYNEYEVPAQYFKRAWPMQSTMTFKFSPDFSSVVQTDVGDFQTNCVAGNCGNVSTGTYLRR